jgi:acyl-[acyl-carrier-protein] desaturase
MSPSTTEIPRTDRDVLHELEPTVAAELDRHLAVAKEWFPHQHVPWSLGRDFDGALGGTAWSSDQSTVTDVGRVALVVNLLTEDNLPSYHHGIATLFGRDGAWGTWVHRWTAEEGRHGTAIRDYLLTSRAADPIELERLRMTHMQNGYVIDHEHSALHSIAYVAFQELATRVSHRNTGRLAGDPTAESLLVRIAADENLHMIFYRNLLAAALEVRPDETMAAICDVVTEFRMPGHELPGFERAAATMAIGGIYNQRIHHDDVLMPVLRHLKVFDISDLGALGDEARHRLSRHLESLAAQAAHFDERQAARRARQAART